MSRWSSRACDEQGAASVVGAAAIAAIVAVTAAVGSVGAAVVARHRAQAAADLAAYSAAVRLTAGPEAACATARSVTDAVAAAVTGCRVDDLDVIVDVAVAVNLPWSPGPARAVARAGPVPGFTPR
ncbi:Rv3654c family TadE-like protein [Mycolicibacterium vaccae]|uniref:Rv3654c family TadE-like protein n=1 Tax=Mycolicibacterium vaccae TaxID=1810 RepID=UPI003CF7D9F1